MRVIDLKNSLPKPEATYVGPGAIFHIYRAKDIHTKKWNHPTLEQITLECRKAYSRYGNRELLDIWDNKAGIYAVRVCYPAAGQNIEEWLSIRMVPGDGKPPGGGELEIYSIRGVRLDKVVQKKFFAGQSDFWNRIVSSSRMCGIHPYNASTGVALENPKHLFTGQCFALIHLQYAEDYPNSYDFVTALIRTDFMRKGLTIKNKGKGIFPLFTPASKCLGTDKSQILLDRKIYTYAFPIYWLNQKKLRRFLMKYYRNNTLTDLTYRKYLRTHTPLPKLLEQNSPLLAGLGSLFTAEGDIVGSKITGAHLRTLLDHEVTDGPELKITSAPAWDRRVRQLVIHAELHKK